MKASRLEKQLYDTLENLLEVLFADGPRQKDFYRIENALASYQKKYGYRHDGKTKSPAEKAKKE